MHDSLRRRILFLGGSARFGSVQIRVVQIARALGCAYAFEDEHTPIDDDKDIFVLVRARGDRAALRRRGLVVWDTIDEIPPRDDVDAYLFSTRSARDLLVPGVLGRQPAWVVPHHHANFEGVLHRPAERRRVVWIGGAQWQPEIPGLRFRSVDTSGKTRAQVRDAYRSADVLLNLRPRRDGSAVLHMMLNSGVKLINAIGFGIPSVSTREAGYFEVGADCTLFCDLSDVATHVRRLRRDRALYDAQRALLRARASEFSLATIARRYEEMLTELAAARDAARAPESP